MQKDAANRPKRQIAEMQYPLWKEENVPDLLCDEEDIEIMKERCYEGLLDYDESEERLTY